jgi:hypothetical protein
LTDTFCKKNQRRFIVTGNGLKDVANASAYAGKPISIPPDMTLLEKAFKEGGIQL